MDPCDTREEREEVKGNATIKEIEVRVEPCN